MQSSGVLQRVQWKTQRSQNTVSTDHEILLSRQSIKLSPKELMRRDFAKQCGLWRKNDERLVIIMDANESTIDGPLKKMLEKGEVELEQFSHKYYGSTHPHTFIDSKILVDTGYKTPDVEIASFCMLSFLDSIGDHMS